MKFLGFIYEHSLTHFSDFEGHRVLGYQSVQKIIYFTGIHCSLKVQKGSIMT